MTDNRQIRLAARPRGEVAPDDWSHVTVPAPTPADGQFTARTRLISLDPAMRGWLDDRPSYLPPVGIDEVMRAGTLVEVTESRHPDFTPGDFVVGTFGVQEHIVSDGRGALKVDNPLPTYLGALGMPGMTAYFGLLEVGALKEGETVVVSGAAGAVGSIVGQIAKLKGCHVIGIAGGPEKTALLTDELGFDVAIDYKSTDIKTELHKAAPNSIDIYFDNVGGPTLDAALANLAMHGRVVICGAISQYNATTPTPGPANYLNLLIRRGRMEGFIVFDYTPRYPEAAKQMASWIANGKIVLKEHVVKGSVDDFPATLNMLFRGENTGKLVLDIT
ncbi:NADP-dependent oxidoreductase [Actinokineospora sp. NPDC004072]